MNKTYTSLAIVFLSLIILEFCLQLRAHFRFGNSILSRATGQSAYYYDAKIGAKLLRPNQIIKGSRSIIVSNSLGLRSSEIPRLKMANEVRIAVLGASTVMGEYAQRNTDTFPALLERQLNQAGLKQHFTVINAGMPGLTINEQTKLFEHLVLPFAPDLLILYTGMNQLRSYCPQENHQPQRNRSLPQIRLPKWVLTYELLTKNTISLRPKPKVNTVGTTETKSPTIDAMDIRPDRYREGLQVLLALLAQHQIPAFLVASTKSYRENMPLEQQLKLSETARYYNHCYDLSALHVAYKRYNAVLHRVARETGNLSLDLDELLSGGEEYFSDASHFSLRGEKRVADILYQQVVRNYFGTHSLNEFPATKGFDPLPDTCFKNQSASGRQGSGPSIEAD